MPAFVSTDLPRHAQTVVRDLWHSAELSRSLSRVRRVRVRLGECARTSSSDLTRTGDVHLTSHARTLTPSSLKYYDASQGDSRSNSEGILRGAEDERTIER